MLNKKIPLALLVCLLMTIFASCSEPSYVKEKSHLDDQIYETSVQPDDCYLCGNSYSPFAPYWGQANLGLLNMNTMEFMVLELNRYTSDGMLIETLARYGSSNGSWGITNNESKIVYSLNNKRGHLDFDVTINENSLLDINNVEQYFCTECLSSIINQYTYNENHWDIAVIDFEARKIIPLQNDGIVATYISDYWVNYRYSEEYDKMYVTAFYCPVRYTELGYDPDETVMEQIVNYCDEQGFALALNDELTNFISRFNSVNSIQYSSKIVRFEEWSDDYRELIVNRDGTYNIYEHLRPQALG